MKSDPDILNEILAHFKRRKGWGAPRAIVEAARRGFLDIRSVDGEERAYVTERARDRWG
jgi:hypothetical protein